MTPSRNTPPANIQIHRLAVEEKFHNLSQKEKLYAHYMARASWHGTRIILRQVSPEAIDIFDFILEVHKTCSGDWSLLVERYGVQPDDLHAFLLYAATFLSNIGNYYGSGDQKFIPGASPEFFRSMSSASPKLVALCDKILQPIFSVPPYSLGYNSDTAQSSYYPGGERMTEDEVAEVSKELESRSIWQENTRIQKTSSGNQIHYKVLQASSDQSRTPQSFRLHSGAGAVELTQGDHRYELEKVCDLLLAAAGYASTEAQRKLLEMYVDSFQTGSLDTYRDALKAWVSDKGPRVEHILGFVEPYRDPYGIRAEFESLVGIADPAETAILRKLVENSDEFIRKLPWAGPDNNGKGPFEKSLFEPPDLSSLHTLAYCSSIIFPGINLPNYNDIRQDFGFKNVIISNRMSAEANPQRVSPFVHPEEADRFRAAKYPAYYWWVVLHELLGHGTGKMMTQTSESEFNFDVSNPPLDPRSNRPITSWYKPGETWTGQFGDLGTTVDECRAELVGAYLMDDPALLVLFGFTDTTDITAKDITYNTYMQLATDGLRGLANFNAESGKWGQAHSRAHFAILKCLLRDGGGVLRIETEPEGHMLTVKLDEAKIITHGKPALGQMLLNLHMYRCTAQAVECRLYYEELSRVDGQFLEWRDIVLLNKLPALIYVQANTFLDQDSVTIKEYDESIDGVIQSWVEREL